MTRISDVMTRGVRTLSPGDTLTLAAQAMQELDVGVIPVCNGRELIGMVTDRDIVLRGVAQGCRPEDTRLDQVMSAHPRWCFEDQSLEDAARQMSEAQIRRLPVVDREKHLVGIVSLGDIAVRGDENEAGSALGSISEPARPDRSSQSQASGTAGGGESLQR
ncbi:CBS domain-containing protein [Caldimonas sp. KR1-144]|uniref:CBS domain-containing protein n=1 Tax=Caldimonas sp. KR1-144 TaxID=3400911 RepID=UPI003BFC9F15